MVRLRADQNHQIRTGAVRLRTADELREASAMFGQLTARGMSK